MRDAKEHARPLLTGLRQERNEPRTLLTPSWQERGSRYGVARRRPSARRITHSVANAADAASESVGSGSSETSSK
jgi:hypothetical protein